MSMPVRIEDDLYQQAKAASQGECRTIASNSKFKTHRTSSIFFLEDSCPKGNLLSFLKTSLLFSNL